MAEQDLVQRIERLKVRVEKLDRLVFKLFEVTKKLMYSLKPIIHPGEEK
jgi:hypothetical protein